MKWVARAGLLLLVSQMAAFPRSVEAGCAELEAQLNQLKSSAFDELDKSGRLSQELRQAISVKKAELDACRSLRALSPDQDGNGCMDFEELYQFELSSGRRYAGPLPRCPGADLY